MESIYIRRLELDDAQSWLDLRRKNYDFRSQFIPMLPDRYSSLNEQRKVIEQVIENWEKGLGYGFGVFLSTHHQLIGRVNLNHVVRGAWDNCLIGYFIDQELNGRGYATEAVRQAVDFAFHQVGLHRVEAAVLPFNKASIRVLEKCGFRKEGYAKHYLKLNGKWEDHLIYAITQEDVNSKPINRSQKG